MAIRVAINGLGNAETNAHLTRYDTVHGKFRGEMKVEGDYLVVNGDKIRISGACHFLEGNPLILLQPATTFISGTGNTSTS